MASRHRIHRLRLEALPGRVTATVAVGFLLGAVLLVAARFVPQLVSPLAFWLLIAALAAGFGIDLIVWLFRGVRAIELDGDALALHRGRRRSVRQQRIERAAVREVRARRRWGAQTIEIRLRKGRVLLRDDAFDREAFASLATLLSGWNRRGA